MDDVTVSAQIQTGGEKVMNEEAFLNGKPLYDSQKGSVCIPLRRLDARKPTFDSTEVGCVQYRIFPFDHGWSLLLTPPERMSTSGSGKRAIDFTAAQEVLECDGNRRNAR
jgi:hypothetical protein